MRIVFFGPPGSGKGTQATRISRLFDMMHISTGLLLREEIRSGSQLGIRIRETVDSGCLVDDETVNFEVFERLRTIDRFLLDGYPRNVTQAQSLDTFLVEEGKPLSGVVFLDVPNEEVLNRLSGRLTCPHCGFIGKRSMFDVGSPCIRCGTSLVERMDDRAEVITMRLRNYHKLTRHLETYYAGRLLMIDGMGSVDEVTERIEKALRTWEL